MLRASPRPLRTLFLVTGLALVGGFGGVGGCQTSHSPGFTKSRPEQAPTAPAPAAARPIPEGTAEGTPEHLLHEYAGRDVAPDAEIRTWDLPTKAKRVIVELLILAARDDASRLDTIMTQQARWGAPDRREYDARPVSDKDGHVFLDVLRQASSRFARKQNLTCPPIMPPAAQIYVKNGSEPMWCFYGSNDNLDILAFKLVVEGGSAKIDYVGMYAERPTRMIPRPGAQPPPMTPMVRRMPRMPNPNMPGIEGGQLIDPNSMPGGVILDVNGQPVQPGVQPTLAQPGAPGQPPQPGTTAGQPGQPGQPGTAAGARPGQPGTNTATPTGGTKPAGGTTGTTKPAGGTSGAGTSGTGTTKPAGGTTGTGTTKPAGGTGGTGGTTRPTGSTGGTAQPTGGTDAGTATPAPTTPKPAPTAPATSPGPSAPAPIR